MNVLSIGQWEVAYDRPSTVEAYRRRGMTYTQCECTDCLNFRVAVPGGLAPEFLQLLGRLGVNPALDGDTSVYGDRIKPTIIYEGWYHFFGQITSGPTVLPVDNKEIAFTRISNGVKIGFTTKCWCVPQEFHDGPLVQLEFLLELPWLLDVPRKE